MTVCLLLTFVLFESRSRGNCLALHLSIERSCGGTPWCQIFLLILALIYICLKNFVIEPSFNKEFILFFKKFDEITSGLSGSQPVSQTRHQSPCDKYTHSRHVLFIFFKFNQLQQIFCKFILGVRHFWKRKAIRERNLTFIEQLLYAKYRNINFIIPYLMSVIDTLSIVCR